MSGPVYLGSGMSTPLLRATAHELFDLRLVPALDGGKGELEPFLRGEIRVVYELHCHHLAPFACAPFRGCHAGSLASTRAASVRRFSADSMAWVRASRVSSSIACRAARASWATTRAFWNRIEVRVGLHVLDLHGEQPPHVRDGLHSRSVGRRVDLSWRSHGGALSGRAVAGGERLRLGMDIDPEQRGAVTTPARSHRLELV